MKKKHTLAYSISLTVMLLFCANLHAQNDSIPSKTKDTLKIPQKYGLRVGIDTGKIIRSFVDSDFKGFEVIADFRYNNRLYIAGEIGTEEKTIVTDYLNTTTKGTYFKGGVDYNLYQNWLDMENMVYTGFRVGASSFSHTLNSFTVYSTNQYWTPQFTSDSNQEFKGLTALWLELVIGIKAEIFKNFYLGLNVQLKGLFKEKNPTNFENIYVPGYNRTYDSSGIGIGFGYTMAYRIPLYKKEKIVAPTN